MRNRVLLLELLLATMLAGCIPGLSERDQLVANWQGLTAYTTSAIDSAIHAGEIGPKLLAQMNEDTVYIKFLRRELKDSLWGMYRRQLDINQRLSKASTQAKEVRKWLDYGATELELMQQGKAAEASIDSLDGLAQKIEERIGTIRQDLRLFTKQSYNGMLFIKVTEEEIQLHNYRMMQPAKANK